MTSPSYTLHQRFTTKHHKAMAAGVSPLYLSFLFLVFFFIFSPCQGGLYSLHDDIVLLDNSTIDSVIYNSPSAWIVEFYSSWCGHCQAFAPTWKKLAKVARDWQNVIHVAAIDCADERNMQTCRDYDIAEYPTIKFFNASMEEKSNKGRNFKVYTKEDKTFINLLHTMVDVAEQQTHLSNHVPDFKSIEEKSTQDFMKGIGLHEILLIVFEEPYSYVGKELALDMMRFPQIAVRRSTDKKSPLMAKYNIARNRFPVLIKIERGFRPTELSRMKRTHADFKRTVLDIAYERQFEEKPFPHIEAVEKAMEHFENLVHEHAQAHGTHAAGNMSEVYMADMVSGLSHMIWNEVPNRKEISSHSFTALKKFLGLIGDCFPGKGRNPLKKFFGKLHIDLSKRVLLPRITSGSFLRMADKINKKPKEGFLTKRRKWHACQGSKPRFRGYPCSLWTLFHTLTVNCGAKRKLMDESDDGLTTLKKIRDYIKHFFGCTKCVEHFTKMAANIDREVKTHDDAILWLWKAHNSANKRLHGDDSEDPKHPKIQFPSKDMCKDCKEDNGEWKPDVVLQFLKDHYGVDNIRVKPPANLPAELEDADQVRMGAEANILATALTLGLNRYDTSLCLVVYTAIGLVFIALYIYFIRRRTRRPYKYHIHTP